MDSEGSAEDEFDEPTAKFDDLNDDHHNGSAAIDSWKSEGENVGMVTQTGSEIDDQAAAADAHYHRAAAVSTTAAVAEEDLFYDDSNYDEGRNGGASSEVTAADGNKKKKKKKRTPEERKERKKKKREKKAKRRLEKEKKEEQREEQKRKRSSTKREAGDREEGAEDGEDRGGEEGMEEGRRKRRKKHEITEAEAAATVRGILNNMNDAADEDEQALNLRKPALAKLSILHSVCEEITKPKWIHWFIREGVCQTLARWLAPLPNGGLPNVTLRTTILKLIKKLPLAVEDLQGSVLGHRLVLMWRYSGESEENRACIREIIQCLLRPLLGVKQSQQAKQSNSSSVETVEEAAAIPKASASTIEPPLTDNSRFARIPYNSGYSFKVQPKSQFKEASADTLLKDSETSIARLNKLMVIKKTSTKKATTRALNVSVSKSVI